MNLDYKKGMSEIIDVALNTIDAYMRKLSNKPFKLNMNTNDKEEITQILELQVMINIVFVAFSIVRDFEEFMSKDQKKFFLESKEIITKIKKELESSPNARTV